MGKGGQSFSIMRMKFRNGAKMDELITQAMADCAEGIDEHYTGPTAPGELYPRFGSGQSDNEFVQYLAGPTLFMTPNGWGRFEDAIIYTRAQRYESAPAFGGEWVGWNWAQCRLSDGDVPF